MSKTVSELAQELKLSKQYINRILSQNNLGRKKGNKRVVSDNDVKLLISILGNTIGNSKSETKKMVSDISMTTSKVREKDDIVNKNKETHLETSFQYIRDCLEIQGEEVKHLHRLLDQSQQLLLNEQKKNKMLFKTPIEIAEWTEEKTELDRKVEYYRTSFSEANARAKYNIAYAGRMERRFWIAATLAGIFLVLLLVLAWIHFFRG